MEDRDGPDGREWEAGCAVVVHGVGSASERDRGCFRMMDGARGRQDGSSMAYDMEDKMQRFGCSNLGNGVTLCSEVHTSNQDIVIGR